MAKEPPKPANADWVPASTGLPKKAPDYLIQELTEQGMHPDLIQTYWDQVLEAQKPGSKIEKPDLAEWLEKEPADIISLKPKEGEFAPEDPK